MWRPTFAARIDSLRSMIQTSARAALRDFESASEILPIIADETSVGCFFGKWGGMENAMRQQTCREEKRARFRSAKSEDPQLSPERG